MQQDSPISLKLLLICGITSVLIVSVYFVYNQVNSHTKIVFCNVGEGSAVYIRVHNRVDILINTGPDKKLVSCLSSYMPFYDRDIEYLFITSFSKNYSSGLLSLLNLYKLHSVYLPPFIQNNKNSNAIKDSLKQKEVAIKNVYDVSDLSIMSSSLQVLTLFHMPVVVYSQPRFKVVLCGSMPGRVISNIFDHNLKYVLKDTYLLQIPVFGFKKELKRNILTLAEPTYIVINEQSRSFNRKNLQTLTTYLKALNKKYYLSNEKEDIKIELN